MADVGVYLYGVAQDLSPDTLRDLPGVAGAPVRTVADAGFTALVSTVDLEEFGETALRRNLESLQWLEATARAHHDVVDTVARAAPTAPVRIATVYRDDDRVRELLRERRDELTEVLGRVVGRVEWGVKAYGTAEAAQEPSGGDDAANEKPGMAYLRRRRLQQQSREEASRRLAEQAQEIHATLSEHAVASRQHPPQDPRLSGHEGTMILNVAYLLDEDRAETLAAAADELAARMPGVRIELTGPWPAYSFTELDASS
ncbi:GvpL/GvpF family gas vesicle protein [Actinoallomurus rhizosphaericola]|uniref:GvpL/GvpF family gas vesicle protein n=1 Tax=Actinoallomurus rhizosphaericola TaxID=2952536 RepID=UPI002093E251|nr:GvpL/GvpF family gas vesicle protein [Actinoallomurus rhizosphaericola]MCO5997184.1 GvpL/GvpF family gas vesicle protein [Actinoallomurus rhizosphaericola]